VCFFLSDITPCDLRSQISDLKAFHVTSDNSHYSIVKDLLLLLSTERRNLNIQLGDLNAQVSTSTSLGDRREPGGGEGIRTPDPRVANAVLCQLSYTPDKTISDFGLAISDLEIRDLKSAICNRERWLRGRDLNPRPLGYEPNELPDCSTPRQSELNSKPQTESAIGILKFEISKFEISNWWAWVESNYRPHAYQACALTN
jgi:hypothetical protein